jgi:hypothetical protein
MKLDMQRVEKPWGRYILPWSVHVGGGRIGDRLFLSPRSARLFIKYFTSRMFSVQAYPLEARACLPPSKEECLSALEGESDARPGIGTAKHWPARHTAGHRHCQTVLTVTPARELAERRNRRMDLEITALLADGPHFRLAPSHSEARALDGRGRFILIPPRRRGEQQKLHCHAGIMPGRRQARRLVRPYYGTGAGRQVLSRGALK